MIAEMQSVPSRSGRFQPVLPPTRPAVTSSESPGRKKPIEQPRLGEDDEVESDKRRDGHLRACRASPSVLAVEQVEEDFLDLLKPIRLIRWTSNIATDSLSSRNVPPNRTIAA